STNPHGRDCPAKYNDGIDNAKYMEKKTKKRRVFFMKRTVEIALSVLGIITSFVIVATGVVFLYLTKSDKFMQYLEEGWSESENAYTLEQLGQAGTMFIIPGLIGIALGVWAAWLLRGNRNSFIAGWGLIIVSVVTCF